MFKTIKSHIAIHKAMKEETNKDLNELQRKLNELKEHCELFDSMMKEEAKAS